MGELIRNYDWEANPLGEPDHWPNALRVSLSILLLSKFPMFVFWGPQYICFFNDALRPILGYRDDYPGPLGMTAQSAFPDIWPGFKPIMNSVFSGGGATFREHQLLPIFREGRLQDVYWTFGFTPITGDDGRPAGLLAITTETTDVLRAKQKIEESEYRFRSLIEESPVAKFLFTGPELIIEVANETVLRKWGKDSSVIGKTMTGAFPEMEFQLFFSKLKEVYATDSAEFIKDLEIRLLQTDGSFRVFYFDFTFNPMRDLNGSLFGILATGVDVTENVRARKKIEESERNFRNLVIQAPVGMCIVQAGSQDVEIVNDYFLDLLGKTREELEGNNYWKVIPEIAATYLPILQKVIQTGISYRGTENKIHLVRHGMIEKIYASFVYEPMRDETGKINRVMILAFDVTQQIMARKKVEESESRFRTMVQQAPIAIGLTRGKEMIFENVNSPMLELIDRTEDIIGKPLLEVLPELKGQEIMAILRQVFESGESYKGFEVPASLKKREDLKQRFFDISYTPFFENGAVTGILQVATDVTTQVLAKKKIIEAEAKARLAIESADLGTYEVDLVTNEMKTSERFQAIWGVENSLLRDDFMSRIHPDDLPGRAIAFQQAYQSGNLNYEARIILADSGIRWLRLRGKVFYDKDKKPSYLLGIAQDISEQKLFTEELEKQVKQRTAEMENKNRQLKEINQELEQFTYAASHDMQEPLRKVHTFTSFLINDHSADLDEEGKAYLLKIGISVQRMKTIIDDLLNYSQQTREDQDFVSTDLNKITSDVEMDLELLIQQKKATILKDPLPVILGVPTQLTQLFMNLYTNALKFSLPEEPVQIKITAEIIPGEKASVFKGLDPRHEYMQIQFRDNGIGFDPQYASHIFDLFKRLHTKSKYEGSGIGLGLCKKIVQNHNGAIWAESSDGEGATFYLLLPIEI